MVLTNEKRSRSPKPVIPLSLLTGFLGAGKTTLLNRLLRDTAFAGTAVIVNEFGDVGLDHLLVEQATDGIIELSSGCVCCTIRGELVDALERLLRAIDNRRIGEIRRVVIETTGLADPAPILQILTQHPYLGMRFRLDGIVTVVDAVNGMATLDRYQEAVRQAAVADRIVVTKRDLGVGDWPDLSARLTALNPGAAILDAAAGEAIAERLIACAPFGMEAGRADVREWLAAEAIAEHDKHDHDASRHGDDIASRAIFRERPMAAAALGEFLDRLTLDHADRLIRVKGLVGLADDPSRPVVVHGVQGRFSPPLRLDDWPDGDRRSRLVLIGRKVDFDAIERLFDTFLGEPRTDTPDRQALVDNPLAIAGFSGDANR